MYYFHPHFYDSCASAELVYIGELGIKSQKSFFIMRRCMGMTYSYSWYKREGNNVPFIQHHHIRRRTHTDIYIHIYINISYKILCTFSPQSQQYGNIPTSMKMVY